MGERGEPQAPQTTGEGGEREAQESGEVVGAGNERSILAPMIDGWRIGMEQHPASETSMQSTELNCPGG